MSETFQLSLPLPRSLDTRIHIHLNIQPKSVLVFLTTVTAGVSAAPPSLGSFVYALPDKFHPDQPLSTPLFTVESSIEFAARLAKLLARKTQLPVHVGNSSSFANAGLGGTVEEEMEAFKKVVDIITAKLQGVTNITNGVSNLAVSS